MTEPTHESTAAWRELLDTLRDLDQAFLTGDRAVQDDRHLADGYRQLATTLGVAFDTYLFAEPSRPFFLMLNFLGVHDPVAPPEPWASRFAGGSDSGPTEYSSASRAPLQ